MRRFAVIVLLGTVSLLGQRTYQDAKHEEHKKSVERVGGGAAGGALIGALAGGKRAL